MLFSWGYFRGMEMTMAGVTNDQKMLKESEWNRRNVLTADDESLMGDGGYWCTQHINVTKPFSESEAANNEYLKYFNKIFNGERAIIERAFAFLKEMCSIFDRPWKRKKHLLPIALRVSLKLCNRYWRQERNMPLGLKRQRKRAMS